MTNHYLQYQDKKIHFTTSGTGNPVVLLHGFCEDLRVWEDFLPLLPDHQYICIDLPGFGESEVIENSSISDMAEVVAVVLAQLNIQKTSMIGHSMGGYVALAFAKKYGDQLTGLGLFHSHPFADTGDKKAHRDRQIQFIEQYGAILYVRQLIPKLFSKAFSQQESFIIAKLTHQAVSYLPAGIIAALKAMRDRPDESDVLEKITCPVLYLIGTDDETIPEDMSRKQTVLATTGLIYWLPKVGHMGMFESPKRCAKAIKDFLVFSTTN